MSADGSQTESVPATACADDTGAEDGAADGAHREGRGAVAQLATVLDLGDRADAGEPAVDGGHEHEPAVGGGIGGGAGGVGLEGDGDHGVGEDHARGCGEHGEGEGELGDGHAVGSWNGAAAGWLQPLLVEV